MAAGWIFHLDVNAYLLLGVPLVVLFQLFVARRPLRNLWVRDATTFRLGLIGVVLAALLILTPGYDLFFVALPKKSWVVTAWFLCAMAGAVFAAFALSRQRASAALRGLPSFVAQLLIGIAITATIAITQHHSIGFPLPKLAFLVKQFLLYFTVCFAVEEVVFRGALDSHVYQPRSDGQASGSPWLSAIFVSALLGDLAFAYSSRFQRIGICRGDPICDRCSHFIRSASFLLLASERYVSLTGSGTCSG